MKHSKLFLKATVCSLLTLVLYLIGSPLIAAVTNQNAESVSPFFALLLLSVFVMAVYSYLFIYISYIRSGYIEDSLFKREEYRGIRHDIIDFLKNEKAVLITVAIINLGSWLLINIEKLVLGKRVLTSVLFIYIPLTILGTVLPDWLNSLPAYVISSFVIYLFYITELAIVRKMTYKKMYLKK